MNVSRRGLLQAAGSVAAGLVIPFYAAPARIARAAAASGPPPVNAFLRIATDDTVSIVLSHVEMGQSIWTGMSMLVAEELDCDWSKVRPEHSGVAPVYNHTRFGFQITGGSSSTNSEFERYRTVGATAKDMLVRAAAARWKVSPARCTVSKGVISHGAKTLTFGQVAEDAMKLKPPASVRLKAPEDWKLLGTIVKRLDTPEKITGKAVFGMDISFPGLRTAVVARPPAFGAKLVRYDAAAALAIPGVEKVVPTDHGVAVVAKHFWAAKLGRDALSLTWSKPEGGGITDATLLADFAARARKPGAVALDTGKVEAAMGAAAARYDVQYDVPYLAHAPMEPLNCTIKIEGNRCDVWSGTQGLTLDRMSVARVLGIPPENVEIHVPFLGGAFGRRGTQTSDFVTEAALVAKAAGVPVKVVWTREDDIRGGYYRPAFLHRVQVGVDKSGMPIAWDHVLVGQSILSQTPLFEKLVKNGVDESSVEGVQDSPYLEAVPAKRVSLHSPKLAVPISWFRAVGHTHTAFAMESMLDELAHAAGKDPLAYRLALLEKKPRHATALKLAAEKGGWGTPLPPGRAHGMAVHEAFGSIVAQLVEVSVERRTIHVHRVTCAVDCGTAVNPLALEAQIQGSVAYALSSILYGKLTFVDGQVQESNFHDYKTLRMFEMPQVAVHVISSGAPMGGIGEPACAPLAPAVANAVFVLTKQRLRTLPLRIA
ncbi:xanthine dehydrogenase family protein molybdopterin-binding subunit [Pendulispora rubella]|uniref:Xanthine dehydrogenase family protein molybdopterin-binding subunit n=1 Tax=Pendulispora rubella TaxID=2741070 RepID=A0ABZ2KSA2_9BACT